LMNGSVEGKFQILEGKEGWLFLNNDTNKSIEQYTGKLKLSRTAQTEWKEYLVSLDNFSRSSGTPVCLLVAPSKEMVYEEYYPYSFSKRAPIQKLKELIPNSLSFILPVKELRDLEQRSFRVCDTHWSLHGARLAAQLVASKLSSSNIEEINVFSNDVYQNKVVSGDLGSKLYPPQRHEEDSLTNFNYKQCVVFDNNIDNFGRIIVMHRQHAVFKKTLLVFGSSSSYTMFHYLCRLYSSVVFAHTAGNLDHKIIDVVRPDCICAQTNARFVVKAPKFNDSVVNYIERKKEKGTLEVPFIAETLPSECALYIDYFKQALV
jgi:alginate O-acetyltransferase complex protein AlgJ